MSIRITPSRAPSAAQNSSDCARQYCVTCPGLDHPRHRPDHDRAEDRLRQVGEQSGEEEDREQRHQRGHEEGDGRLRADALGRRRRRRPAGDGEALQRAGADVRGAVAQHLAVRRRPCSGASRRSSWRSRATGRVPRSRSPARRGACRRGRSPRRSRTRRTRSPSARRRRSPRRRPAGRAPWSRAPRGRPR